MKDYSDIGLDGNLNKIGGLASRGQPSILRKDVPSVPPTLRINDVTGGHIRTVYDVGRAGVGSADAAYIRIDGTATRITGHDGTVDRFFLGWDNSRNFKIKMSQPGIDVFTATDDQLAISSDFNSFKIVATGTVGVSGTYFDQTTTLGTVTHNLGYVPLVQAALYVSSGTLASPLPTILNTGNDYQGALQISGIGTSTFTVQITVNTSGTLNFPSRYVRWYALRETSS